MASIGDDGSETDPLAHQSTTQTSSAVLKVDNVIDDLENAQDDQTSEGVPEGSSRDEDEFGSDDEDHRDNRFYGTSSSWRYFTENERALAASLDQQQADDLSTHLYNAHALKARVRDPDAASKVKAYHSKKRWIKPNEDGTLPWHPDAAWTAWPLTPENVPRRDERFGGSVFESAQDSDTYRMPEDWKPSADLEDEILAIMLRKAKEGFRQRVWAIPASNTKENSSVETLRKSPDRQNSDSGSDADVSMDDVSDDSENIAKQTEGVELFSGDFVKPAFITDDEKAREILQPTVRHVLSKFDDLLIGLHKSREGHVRNNVRSRSGNASSRSTSKTKAASMKGKTKARTSVQTSDDDLDYNDLDYNDLDHNEDISGDDSEEEHNAASEEKQNPKRRRPLNPRDWSEVLGIASLIGWDAAVVDRTARRCALLFGEGMTFHTMPSASSVNSNCATIEYDPRMKHLPHPKVEDDDFIVDHELEKKWHFCPVNTCLRHEEPYEKAWRWREHLKRSHKYGKARIEGVEARLQQSDLDISDNGAVLDEAGDGGGSSIATANAVETTNKADAKPLLTKDGLLHPITVKMGRGKNLRPRKRKAANQLLTTVEDESSEEL